jgi:hypothetical protein
MRSNACTHEAKGREVMAGEELLLTLSDAWLREAARAGDGPSSAQDGGGSARHGPCPGTSARRATSFEGRDRPVAERLAAVRGSECTSSACVRRM